MTRSRSTPCLIPAVYDLQAVGRVGHLSLEYARQGDRTVLVRSSCTTPWHVLPPSYPDDAGYAYTLLMNPSGGLVGGDCLSAWATLGDASHVLMSTPSANRLYRSAGKVATQHIRLDLGAGALLEWLPDIAIPYAGSRFRQTIEVSLGVGATVVVWDAMASGRVARGERWIFEEFHNDIGITTSDGTSVIERYALTPDASGDGIGLADEWDYIGTFLIIGEALDRDRLALVADRLYAVVNRASPEALGGISAPAVRGLAIKLVAKSALVLSRLFDSVWRMLRLEVLGLRHANLRRY